MLYKVTVGRDEYLGTAEQVVLWMSQAQGAPTAGPEGGGPDAYMRGVRDRVVRSGSDAEIDVTDAALFLESLHAARLLRLEERRESSTERVAPKEVLDEGPVAFGDSVSLEELEDYVFPEDGEHGGSGFPADGKTEEED